MVSRSDTLFIHLLISRSSGRVLISGSDPLTTVYNEDGSINEELSYPGMSLT